MWVGSSELMMKNDAIQTLMIRFKQTWIDSTVIRLKKLWIVSLEVRDLYNSYICESIQWPKTWNLTQMNLRQWAGAFLLQFFFFFCGFWLLSNDSCNMSNIIAWKYFFGLVYYLCWVWLIDRHKRDANSEIIGYWAEFDCNVIVNLQFIWQTNEMYLDKTKHIDVRYITC